MRRWRRRRGRGRCEPDAQPDRGWRRVVVRPFRAGIRRTGQPGRIAGQWHRLVRVEDAAGRRCSVITDTDVKELFGGDVEPVENDDDDDNSCSFSVTNANGLAEDYAADTPQIVSVTFDEGWIGYDEEKQAMGDAVDKVEGLGSEAWIGLGAIHVDLGDDNELVVTTVFGTIYDQQVIEGERYALAKLVVSRL